MIFLFTIFIGYILINKFKLKPKSKYYLIYGIFIGIITATNPDSLLLDSSEYMINISPSNLIFYFIPPLMYKASYDINFHIFKTTFFYNLTASLLGVITNVIFISIFLYNLDIEFHNKKSLIISTILSAIDPIAITTILPELTLSDKLLNLIESESLLNDEISICLFYLMNDYVLKDKKIGYLIIKFIRLISLGFLVGVSLLVTKIYLLKKLSSNLISQATLSIVFAYLSFYIADSSIFNASGILAVVVMGILMSAFGKTRISPDHIDKIDLIWKLLSEYSNLLIFSISGFIITNKIDFKKIYRSDWFTLIYLYLFINLVRLVQCLFFYTYLKKNILHYDFIDFMVVLLSGIRGEISLALSLTIWSKEGLEFTTKNKILFYVSGIVLLSISINSLLIKNIIKNYHRDKILLDTRQLEIINSTIDRESSKYIEEFKGIDFHLTKVDYEKVNSYISKNLNSQDIIIQNQSLDRSAKRIFLNTLKKNIWILFEEHILHYDIVMKLIDITDANLDNLEINWYKYMNEYCQKEHIRTKSVCIISNIPILKYLVPSIISYLIEYNYNLVLGYIISVKKSLKKVSELVNDEEIMNKISAEVEDALREPYRYVEFLEQNYADLLSKIETKQVILLLIGKQKSHLEYLKKNGEISDRIYDELEAKFIQRELNIKHG